MNRLVLTCLAILTALLAELILVEPAPAYIGGPPLSLGIMCNWSTHVMIAKVDKIDRDKNVVIFTKVRDLKGKWPSDVVRQYFNPGLPTRGHVMNWCEPGRTVMFYALESYKWSHTYVDGEWYAANTADWNNWTVSHSEPLLLRMYAGRTTRLADASMQILAGKEVVVPGMIDGPVDDLIKKRAGYQRLRASLKLLDYNAKRDLVGPGKDDFEPVVGMAGFAQMARLVRMGNAQAITCADFTGKGSADLCLVGIDKITVMLNGGDYMQEIAVPGLVQGCRAAVAADYDGDGKADLLLTTATGPRLYTNLGAGHFRDDTALLPTEAIYTLTAAAWIDYDGDGYPDILLANGYHGLRLYRNKGKQTPAKPAPIVKGKPLPAPPLQFADWSNAVGLGSQGPGANVKGYSLSVCDVNGDGRPDFLYGAGGGMLFLNTAGRFAIRDAGIFFAADKAGPIFGDFNGDGIPDLFVAQSGQCKLIQGLGNGRFRDVTDTAGDLARPLPWATSAAWGDIDNDGHLDLVVGCLKGPNRCFRNRGDGAFEDCTEKLGLDRKHFNTQAVCLVDLNGDGKLDMIFNNEGQEGVALLQTNLPSPGTPGEGLGVRATRTPVTLFITGGDGVVGARVRIFDHTARLLKTHEISGGAGRHQPPPQAHFALVPGDYRVEVRYSSGMTQTQALTVADTPLRTRIEPEAK